MKANVLISGGNVSRANYENAIAAVGGLFGSFYLPQTDAAFLSSYDGLLLAGGGDMDPACFGQEDLGSASIDRERDQVELELVRCFMEAGKPILGICRGHQVVNVALGGTLKQDLDETGKRIHTPERRAAAEDALADGIQANASMPEDKVHLTRAADTSFLGRIYGPTFSVNSFHHQSIDRLADPLLAIQWTMEDGCVEAALHTDYPYIGVQWHPERMCLAKSRPDTVDGLAVFEYFLSLFR